MSLRDLRRGSLVAVLALLSACDPIVVESGVLTELPDGATTSPPVMTPEARAEQEIELGRRLFFDRALSARQDTSCATCHIIFTQTTEPLALSLGTGALGIGPTRMIGSGHVLPRNTTDLFLRGSAGTTALFWDGRLERLPDGSIRAPIEVPEGLDDLLAIQALLPMLDRAEMRGPADATVIGAIPDDRPAEVFDAIMARLLSPTHSEYSARFEAAYPETQGGRPTITHVARALAAFQRSLWNEADTLFDLGMVPPNTVAAREGRALFFGDGGCSRCHGGPLFSDQRYHNIGVPQLGPGKDETTHLDEGRYLVTNDPADRFAFRTPSLRNVSLTGPWMHNGAYGFLEDVILHHIDPETSLRAYTGEGLPPTLAATIRADEATLDAILETLDLSSVPLRPLTDFEITALVEFLNSLTSSEQLDLQPGSAAPPVLPSGFAPVVWPAGVAHPFRNRAFPLALSF